MKGQISFVEYLVAMTIFITFSVYFFYYLMSFLPNYLNQLESERIRSEAYQISEMLINDPGEPTNWYLNPNNAKRIGFSDENFNQTNLLSLDKINAIGIACTIGYKKIKKLIGSDLDFSIILRKKPSNNVLLACVPLSSPTKVTNVTIRRIVSINTPAGLELGELILQVW